MEKNKISSIFNEKNENYLKINIMNIDSEIYIKTIVEIFKKLEITGFLNSYLENQSFKYKHWIGIHEFLKNEKYIIHIILEEKFIHIIFKCSIEERKNFMKIIKKYCSF